MEFAGFLRSHRERIVTECRRAARPPGRAGGPGALAWNDDLPRILDDLAAVVEASPAAGGGLPANVGDLGLHTLASGFELDQAVGAYALLREVILRLWARTAPVHPIQPVHVLDAALDRAIASAVTLHTAERKRSQDEQRATELGAALDRAQALAAIRAGEVAARRGEERLHFLAEASALLASSLDVGRVAQRLTDLAVPRIADWCLLDLVATDGAIHAAAISSDDPNPLRLERVTEYRSTHPLRADAPYGIGTVLRTGEPLLLPHVSHEELRAIAPDEQYVRWVVEAGLRSILAVPLRGASAMLGVLSFGTSHSGRVLGEEERDLAQALAARAALALENARLYEEAQRAVRLREQVLAVVSHDLKSPLSAIGLTAQLLARKLAGDPGVLRSLANIESAASHASALLRDLLDMASIQAGRLAVTAEPTDPGEIAGDALEQLAPVAQERGVTISLEGRGPPVLADRGRLVQVLGNLLGNAVKASARGSAVTLRLTEVAGGVRFEVIDAGVGIAPEDLPRIFEAYWSAQPAPGAPARERGSGLGLVIAKGILDAHGASLEVESTLGRGATFSFTLPRG